MTHSVDKTSLTVLYNESLLLTGTESFIYFQNKTKPKQWLANRFLGRFARPINVKVAMLDIDTYEVYVM